MRPYHQQTSVNSDQLPHDHVYESNSISQTSYPESVARPQLPHYMSQNPYQEGLSGYQDHQDNGEGRWHLFQGKENLALKSGHQHFHPQYYSTRVDYQDQGLPPIETLSGHSRFQEKVSDRGTLHQRKRDVEEARMRLPTRGRLGHSEYQEPDLNGESGATQMPCLLLAWEIHICIEKMTGWNLLGTVIFSPDLVFLNLWQGTH